MRKKFNKQRSLSSEELGREGERIFPTFCTGLIVNNSDEDLAGWDYIIDFENKDIEINDFPDKVDDPLAARVQLKTIWYDNKKVKAPLKAMQRLVAYNGPSFLIVQKYHPEKKVIEIFASEILDDFLEKILKKLTLSNIDENLSKKEISFTVNQTWKKIDIKDQTPIKDYLVGQIQQSASGADYVTKKRNQRLKLGIDENSHTIEIKIANASSSEIEDAFLGIKAIPITEGTIFETRFGKKRKIEILPKGTELIAKTKDFDNSDRCLLKLKSENIKTVRTIIGNIIIPPPMLKKNLYKSRFIGGAVSVIFHHKDHTPLNFHLNLNEQQNIHSWIQQLNFISGVNERDATIEIVHPIVKNTINLKKTNQNLKTKHHLLELIKRLEHLQTILEFIDATNLSFSILDFRASSKKIEEIYWLQNHDTTNIRLHIDVKNNQDFIGKNTLGFATRIKFKNLDIVYIHCSNSVGILDGRKTQFNLTETIVTDFVDYKHFNANKDNLEKDWQVDNFILDADSGLKL